MTADRQIIFLPAAMICIAILVFAIAAASPARAEHIQPHECGVKSGSFARICRPNAYPTCLRSSARGVKGFSAPFCARRQIACRSCLDKLRACIKKIGHAKKSEYSCDECTGKISRCIGKRYPQLKS